MTQAIGPGRGFLVTACALFCLAPAAASAHGALPSIFEIAESDGEIIGLGATFGLLLRTPDGGFQYACEDVLGTPVSGYVVRSTTDAIAVTRTGVWRTEDAGCSYRQLETAVGELPIAEVRTEQGSSYVTTASASQSNSVFRSEDGGLTWTQFGPELDGTALFGLAVAGDRVVVSGLSADGWTVYDWSAGEPEALAMLAEGTLDAEVWVVGETVWVADIIANESELYEIVDGVAEPRGSTIEGVVTDVAGEGERVLVATDTDTIFEVVGGQLSVLEEERGTCFVTLEDGRSARCGSPVGEDLVLVGPVGSAEPLLLYDSITANPCVLEEGHPCEPIWPFAARLFGVDAGTEPEPEDSGGGEGCTSASHSATSLPIAVFVGLLLFRRRRYSASQISVSSRSARSD